MLKNSMKDQSSKKAKLTQAIVAMIAAVISYFTVQNVFFKNDVESELKKAAVEVNKQTPLQIDQYTRLDSASSRGKEHFIYYYTLVNTLKSEVNLDTVNKYVRTGLIDNVKNNPELKPYRENNITMNYRYYDKEGEFALEIAVTPDLYKKK